MQNCHIILRLCSVKQGESLHLHKACQNRLQQELYSAQDCRQDRSSLNVRDARWWGCTQEAFLALFFLTTWHLNTNVFKSQFTGQTIWKSHWFPTLKPILYWKVYLFMMTTLQSVVWLQSGVLAACCILECKEAMCSRWNPSAWCFWEQPQCYFHPDTVH